MKKVAGRSCEFVARARIAENRSRTCNNCTASPRQPKAAYNLSLPHEAVALAEKNPCIVKILK
jgi:hypothetical protein